MAVEFHTKYQDDVWCGYDLDNREKEVLINITLNEFLKRPKHRKPSFLLVADAKYIVKKERILKKPKSNIAQKN